MRLVLSELRPEWQERNNHVKIWEFQAKGNSKSKGPGTSMSLQSEQEGGLCPQNTGEHSNEQEEVGLEKFKSDCLH